MGSGPTPAAPTAGGTPSSANPLDAPITRPHKRARIGHSDYTVDATGQVRALDRDRATASFMTGARNAQRADAPLDAEPHHVSRGGAAAPTSRGAATREHKRERQLARLSADQRRREMRQLRAAREEIEDPAMDVVPTPLPAGAPSLQEQARDVMTLQSSFNAERGAHAFPGTAGTGSLTPSHLPWFALAPWNPHAPREPSAFAKPLDATGTGLATTYNKNEGVFSAQNFNAPTPEHVRHLALVSAAESVRGTGAGLLQLLAQNARGTAGVASRDEMYGRTQASLSVPGMVPASYAGSAMDIQLAERDAAERNLAGLADNPFARQGGEVLALQRDPDARRDAPPFRRSRSAGLPARPQDYEADADRRLEDLGLRPLRPSDTQ